MGYTRTVHEKEGSMAEFNRQSQRPAPRASQRSAQRTPRPDGSPRRTSAASNRASVASSRTSAASSRTSSASSRTSVAAGTRQRAAAPQQRNRQAAASVRQRSAAPSRAQKKNGTNPLLLLIIGLVAAGLIISAAFGISSLLGSSDSESSSVSAEQQVESAPTRPTAGQLSAEGRPTTGGGKATAAGKTAVGIVRTPEERMSASSSPNNVPPGPKTVYLTFDDGPSTNTQNILDILDEYGVKATWFVKSDQRQVEYVKDIWAADHQIAIHTYSHEYENIYASVDSYWNDLHAAGGVIKDLLGFEPTLVRFPGGSENSYNKAVSAPIIAQMNANGTHYFDWNVSSGDGANHDAEFLIDYTIEQSERCHSACVLMHDSAAKDSTVEALPTIIEWYIDNDFEFDVLLADSYGYHF